MGWFGNNWLDLWFEILILGWSGPFTLDRMLLNAADKLEFVNAFEGFNPFKDMDIGAGADLSIRAL